MKSLFSLLLALLIIAVIGGTAYFYWDISQGAKFERLDKAAKSESNNAPAVENATQKSAPKKPSPPQ